MLPPARLLDQAEEPYRHGFYPDIHPIAAMTARLQIARGNLESAAAWVRTHGGSVDDDPEYPHEYERPTLVVRRLLAQHRAGHRIHHSCAASPCAAAIKMLDRLHTAVAEAALMGHPLSGMLPPCRCPTCT